MREVDLGGWDELKQDLAPVLAAVTPEGEDVIVSGGVVPLLYRYLDEHAEVRQPALLTTDVDLTIRRLAGHTPAVPLDQRLRDEQFVEIYSRSTQPPVIRYQHVRHGDQELAPIHVEFLTPRLGSPEDRHGHDRSVVPLQGGIHAQALPFLQLLFEEPVAISDTDVPWFRPGTRVYLPHPGTYLLVKLLVVSRPDRGAKRMKDAAYLYDVVTLTRGHWPEIADLWQRLRDSGRHPRPWIKDAQRTLQTLFASATDDGVVWARMVYADAMTALRAPSERAVVQAMDDFAATVEALLAR